VPRPGNQHPVGDLSADGTHPALGIGVRSRAARRDLHHLDPGTGQHSVEHLGELPGPVPDQEPEPAGALSQAHQQVPGLLHGPRAIRVRAHTQDMDMAGADLDHEEHVDPAQGHRTVDMEEIAGQHRGRLRAQELPPRRAAALRRGRDPQPFQDPPHRRGPGPVPETEQFALDPLIAPAGILPRHLPDQHHEPGVNWRPSCFWRIGPPPADQPPMPAQQRVWRHESAPPQRPGEQPGQGGEYRAV
jgi:hypothetical protein